jgi:anti-sigma regulatory factor (Ser/Thr protein kinase)
VQQYFRRTFDSLEGVFAFVEAFLAGRSLDPDLRAPVCFIVEELFTNLVKYNAASPHDIAISLGHTPRQLTVQLMDFDVEPFDVTRAPTVDTNKPLHEREPGGLGLHLVRQMADTLQYGYAERCSTITFTKTLGEG